MPVLVDDDLLFEDAPGGPRATTAVNKWLREFPVSGAPAVRTWQNNASSLREWLMFLKVRGVQPFGDRAELRAALSMYAEYRLAGELKDRWDHSTWNLHMGMLAHFYQWAWAENLCEAVPFTYRTASRMADGVFVEVQQNMAKLRTARRHTTIKYLEADFAELFVRGLAGLGPDGEPDTCYRRPREAARNAAMAKFVLSSGLRRQEFTHLTVYEVPPLPRRPTTLPVLMPLGDATTKGQKPRTTWVHYEPLAAIHQYIELDRSASAEGFRWRPPAKLGEPLLVEEPDWEGAYLNGERRSWRKLRPRERLRLVTPEGQSPLVGLQSSGKPFVDWATVFRRTSAVRAYLGGRNVNTRRPRKAIRAYTDGEWERLESACRSVVDTTWAAHKQTIALAEEGMDPRVSRRRHSPQDVAWLLLRDGPMSFHNGYHEYVRGYLPFETGFPERATVAQMRDSLFPTRYVQTAYALLLGVYSGIVPDGIDGAL
jgi:integrase